MKSSLKNISRLPPKNICLKEKKTSLIYTTPPKKKKTPNKPGLNIAFKGTYSYSVDLGVGAGPGNHILNIFILNSDAQLQKNH